MPIFRSNTLGIKLTDGSEIPLGTAGWFADIADGLPKWKKEDGTIVNVNADGVQSVTGSVDIGVDDTDPQNPILSLENTTVTPGSFTNASITFDAKGRATAASSGTAPVLSVSATAGETTVDNTDPANPIVGLSDTTVTPGTYTNATVTVDASGRLTAASNGSGGSAGAVASVRNLQLTGTSPVSVISYTPASPGNYALLLTWRVVSATTNLSLVHSYTDAAGAISDTLLLTAPQGVGRYQMIVFFESQSSLIDVTMTAGTANNIFVSASIINGNV